jgi:ADP-ribose pyrophosphatase
MKEHVRVGRRVAFRNKWLMVYRDRIRIPSGRIYEYIVTSSMNAVIIVPFISKGKVVIIRQYRHGVERYIAGFPAGFVEDGESAVDAARRELEEELSATARKIDVVGRVYANPSRSRDRFSVVFAYGVKFHRRRKNPDEFEGRIIRKVVPLAELLSEPEILEGGSMLAALSYIFARRRRKNKRNMKAHA